MLAADGAEKMRNQKATSERNNKLRARVNAEQKLASADLAAERRAARQSGRRLPRGVPGDERWIIEGAMTLARSGPRRPAR